MTASEGEILDEIRRQREVEKTYTNGGHPYTFVQLYDGQIVPMQDVEPEVFSFRYNYYYNTAENELYIKKAEWVNLGREFDEEDIHYVYYNGRSVRKMVNEPDPKNFGDIYYYSIISNRVFGRILKWVKCTNL